MKLRFHLPSPCFKFTHSNLVDDLVNLIGLAMFLLFGFVSLLGLLFDLMLKRDTANNVEVTCFRPKNT